MDLSGLQQTSRRAAPPVATYTAQVVRADESGLWVVPLGEDTSSPVGPCKGGWTANGTRVPPGAMVALLMTDDGPWAIGVDNPALAVADASFAPFPNASFETTYAGEPPGFVPVPHWSDFWSNFRRDPDGTATAPDTYNLTLESGLGAAHGQRALRVDGRGTWALLNTASWTMPAGSSLEVSAYAKAIGAQARLRFRLYTAPPGGTPHPFGSGSVDTGATITLQTATPDWLRYRAIITPPPDHTLITLYVEVGANDQTGQDATVWIDNFDVDIVDLNPATPHQDFMRRAALVLTGGGQRQVTAGGNISWSQALTIAGAGYQADEAPDGRFDITQPANGTVIPVHNSSARTTHTVAGGVITLNPDDALWYELPIGGAAASQPARFHIVGTSSTTAYTIPPHWILVVRRSAWSASHHAAEYKWGDGRRQDPWRTPSYNSGWIDGTIAGRFTKTGDQLVIMRGRVRNGTGSAFTLPAGYWPGVQHEAYVRDGAGAAALITVTTAGVVTTAGNNTDHSIATSFVAEP